MKQAGIPVGSKKGCVTGHVSRSNWWRHSVPESTVGTERIAVQVEEDSNRERTKGKVPLGKGESRIVQEEEGCM